MHWFCEELIVQKLLRNEKLEPLATKVIAVISFSLIALTLVRLGWGVLTACFTVVACLVALFFLVLVYPPFVNVVITILNIPFFITIFLFIIIAGPVFYVYKYFQK
jgi:hypothetical protein